MEVVTRYIEFSDTNSRILFVDNEPAFLNQIVRALIRRDLPFRYVKAASADLALDLAQTTTFPVAVVDLCVDDALGVESGMRLIERLKEINPDTRVLVLSGSLNKNVEREAIKRGAFRFIPKGTDINVLVAELWNAFLAGSVSLKSYRHEAAAVA